MNDPRRTRTAERLAYEAAQATITAIVPPVDRMAQFHHDGALRAISRFKNTRGYDAEANLRSWRRLLTKYDPNGKDGWAFEGSTLQAGAEVKLRPGPLIVGLDDSWAKGNWYAGDDVRPRELTAFLAQAVEGDGLRVLVSVSDNAWASGIIGLLNTNPEIVSAARVTTGMIQRRTFNR